MWRARGLPRTALTCFEQSLSVRSMLGDRKGEGWMLLRIAETLAATGDESKARETAAEAMAIAEVCGDKRLADACTQIPHAGAAEVRKESECHDT